MIATKCEKTGNAQNAKLRAHGYTWHKEDEESMDFAGPNAFEASGGKTWTLTDDGGREVTICQALEEIEAK